MKIISSKLKWSEPSTDIDPISGKCRHIPIYRVSPQLLVTNEHIMSDSASTSVSDSFCDSGDVAAVCGLDCDSMRGVVL